jgi:hypothetical protein
VCPACPTTTIASPGSMRQQGNSAAASGRHAAMNIDETASHMQGVDNAMTKSLLCSAHNADSCLAGQCC